MRAYVPGSLTVLRDLQAHGFIAAPVVVCAVLPALRDWYPEGDDEALEFAAQSRAADLSLALLGDDATPRRIVIAVDVQVEPDDGVDPLVGARTQRDVNLADVAAFLVDDVRAAPLVRAAYLALGAEAKDVPPEVEALDDHELAWFGVQEIGELLADH